MANKIRCSNGHWYDADRYNMCPHCARQGGMNMSQESFEDEEQNEIVMRASPKKGWFSNLLGKKKTDGAYGGIDWVGVRDTPMEEDRELGAWQRGENGLVREIAQSNGSLGRGAVGTQDDYAVFDDVDDADNVKNTENSVKTVSYYSWGEPVVGWLVCVKGAYFGQAFNLKTGRNFIGRSMNMDVCILKDKFVSREKHGVITFDPRIKEFFIQQGESSMLIYVNGETLYERRVLNMYDEIEIGRGLYVFFPLCSKGRFDWEDYSGDNSK